MLKEKEFAVLEALARQGLEHREFLLFEHGLSLGRSNSKALLGY